MPAFPAHMESCWQTARRWRQRRPARRERTRRWPARGLLLVREKERPCRRQIECPSVRQKASWKSRPEKGKTADVLKQLANIEVGFWLWQTQLLQVPEAVVQHVFIHI